MYVPRFHIVLHQPEIPGNTGAVGRTCVALRAKLWLVRPLGFRIDEKTLRRAGLDYWKHLVWRDADDWNHLLDLCPGTRYWYFTKQATQCFWDTGFKEQDVLVFGSETIGLPQSILQSSPERQIRIPIHPDVRSLNLSSAVAVAGYEVARQLGQTS